MGMLNLISNGPRPSISVLICTAASAKYHGLGLCVSLREILFLTTTPLKKYCVEVLVKFLTSFMRIPFVVSISVVIKSYHDRDPL